MYFKHSGDIFKTLSTLAPSATGDGQYWYETDTNLLKYNTPNGTKEL